MKEQWSEQHQDHPVFQKGVEVRVAYEDLMHKLRYGQTGKVIGHVDGEVCVQLKGVEAPAVMPAEILVSNAGAPKFKPLRTFLRTTNEVKQSMLRLLGVTKPTEDNIEVLEVHMKTLSDFQLDTFIHCCRWALDLDEVKEIQIAPSKLVGLLLQGHLGFGQGAEDAEAQKRRMRVFKYMHKVSKMMLIPIRGSGPPEHVTLLVLRKGEEPCVR